MRFHILKIEICHPSHFKTSPEIEINLLERRQMDNFRVLDCLIIHYSSHGHIGRQRIGQYHPLRYPGKLE